MKLNINCRKCDDSPDEPLTASEATEWAMQHGKEAHDQPYQGIRVRSAEK